MSTVTRHALRVYAALTELKGNHADVLDALIPFFEPILQVMDGRIFDPQVFAAGVKRLYHWRFTGDVASQFIPRLQRLNLLKRGPSNKNGAVWVVTYGKASLTDSSTDTITGVFRQIVDEFVQFPPRVTDLLAYNKSRDELEDILVRFLVAMDSETEGAYAPQLGPLHPGGPAGELLAQLEEGGRPLHPNDRYMCARFVRYLTKKHPQFIPHLARLSSIALLTEVVEDFLKPTDIEAKTDLTVILDAPLALDLLGCSGKALKDDMVAVVDALRNIGAAFIVLPGSCVEMQSNLRSMLALPVDRRRGYTHDALVSRQVAVDYVTAVANSPERALEEIGITVRPLTLESLPNTHRYFTATQYEDFFQTITWGNDIPAREHDATCATIVMRLRQGQQSSDIFKCKYVLVTRNPTFVRKVREYCLASRMITQLQEGPVIHQRELATTAWLRTGLGAGEAIPRGHLIAVCDRVLKIRPEVRAALANQLAHITPERLEQFNLLMQDVRSVQKLADLTLNNEEVVTAENAEHLLEVIREATAEEVKERYEADVAANEATARERSERTAAELAELHMHLKAAETRDVRAKALEASQIKAIVEDVNNVARRTEIGVAVGLVAIGILSLINLFTGTLAANAIWSIVAIAAGILGGIRLIFAVLERTMPALGSLLNWYCRGAVRRRLLRMGLPEAAMQRMAFEGGRIALAPPEK